MPGKVAEAAAESTMRSVKHPFRNGKVPVRGRPSASMVMITFLFPLKDGLLRLLPLKHYIREILAF